MHALAHTVYAGNFKLWTQSLKDGTSAARVAPHIQDIYVSWPEIGIKLAIPLFCKPISITSDLSPIKFCKFIARKSCHERIIYSYLFHPNPALAIMFSAMPMA